MHMQDVIRMLFYAGIISKEINAVLYRVATVASIVVHTARSQLREGLRPEEPFLLAFQVVDFACYITQPFSMDVKVNPFSVYRSF